MRRRPGLEVPGEGAVLAPLEVRQAGGRVWCLVVMAPLEVPQGQVLAGARSREELTINHHLVSLPTFDQLADRLVLLTRQTFGKVVGTLLLGINLQNLDFTRVNMRPEEVPLDQEILGTTGDLLTGGQQQCAIVVLKDATSKGLEMSRW